jgi:hypothetical protein
MALNDPYINREISEIQIIEDVSISVLRFPVTLSWAIRVRSARKWLEEFNPHWVSLQFVPFGFHPKGLSFGLARHLESIIGSYPLHWMFHELWVLWSFPLSLRKRLLGQVQRIGLRSCLEKLKPKAVATHLPIYKEELKKLGWKVTLLPLHGNIPIYPPAEANQWLEVRSGLPANGQDIKGGFFGNILPTLNPSMVADWISKVKMPGRNLVILSAGKIGGESECLWNSLTREFANNATFLRLGELDERDSSFYFSTLDYGLTAYPPELMGKSGSVAAMREHGLPVVPFGSLASGSGSPTREFSVCVTAAQPWTVRNSAEAFLQQLETERA